MQETAQTILNDSRWLSLRDEHFRRLEDVYAGQTLDRPPVVGSIPGRGVTDPYLDPESWVGEALDDLAGRVEELTDPLVFRPPVIEFGPYGVHFVDRILGAGVFELRGRHNWQARPLGRPVGGLQAPDLARDETWALARSTAEAFLKHRVALPLFGLPTIASALNIAMNLYGQDLLLAFLTDPAAVRHDLKVINDLLCRLHGWYLDHLPGDQLQPVVAFQRTQPPGYGQLCGCSTQMLPAEIYQEFVAPLDEQLLAVYPHGGMIHICGAHAQHISAWRGMGTLRAVQLNDRAAEDLEIYFNELRDDQVLYVSPCAAMPLERIMRITHGRRLVLIG